MKATSNQSQVVWFPNFSNKYLAKHVTVLDNDRIGRQIFLVCLTGDLENVSG